MTEECMQRLMGRTEGKAVLLGTFFGFISSSCCFPAFWPGTVTVNTLICTTRRKMASKGRRLEYILEYLAYFSFGWLLVGMILYFVI